MIRVMGAAVNNVVLSNPFKARTGHVGSTGVLSHRPKPDAQP